MEILSYGRNEIREGEGEVKVLNEYPTHHYFNEYEKTELFCPHCGKQEVWEEQSPGDYYCGPDFICTSCAHNFSIQGPLEMFARNQIKQLEQLRTGVTFEPTTPKGH